MHLDFLFGSVNITAIVPFVLRLYFRKIWISAHTVEVKLLNLDALTIGNSGNIFMKYRLYSLDINISKYDWSSIY